MNIQGVLAVPGDKSISHRVAMLCALAEGESVVRGFLGSEDCLNTLRAVEALGATVVKEGNVYRVGGAGGRFNRIATPVDLGNSGTGMRLLAGLLAGQPSSYVLTGDSSLQSRPMGRIKDPLEMMGARVELEGAGGCAPIRISGGRLKAIRYALPVASAQVKSCILLAGLTAEGTTSVVQPEITRDHTERILAAMGARLAVSGLTVTVEGSGGSSPGLRGGDWDIPGDFSSAAFWMVAAAGLAGSEVRIENVGLNPTRTALIDVLLRMGAGIEILRSGDQTLEKWEPRGDLVIRGGELTSTEVGGDEIPNLIDELPLVSVAAALADGKTVIRDAGELRVKESDRIAGVARGLSRLGVKVREHPDGLEIEGGCAIGGGVAIDSYGDHRIAMAMAILALFAKDPVHINGIDCIATSYPGFWDDMDRIVDR